MSGHLLDVNVLISLIDPAHVHHHRAHAWFAKKGKSGWLSCPTTQNGVVRIVSHPRYPNAQATPATALESLRSLTSVGNHRFLSDEISLLDPAHFTPGALLSSAQLTDTYLVALAAHADAALATLDRRIVTTAVSNRQAKVVQIP